MKKNSFICLFLMYLELVVSFSNLTSSVNREKLLTDSCPYSGICLDSCYICEDNSLSSSCLDDSVLYSCGKYKPICPNSEVNSVSGSKTFQVYPKSFCIWEFNLISSASKSDSINLNFNSSPPISLSNKGNSLTIISYKSTHSKPDRNYASSTVYLISSNNVIVRGNYFLVVCWYNDDTPILLSIKWEVQGSHNNDYFTLILATLIPCIALSCCLLCIYSYCRRRRNQISPQLRYEVVNRDDLLDESFMNSILPQIYYLVKTDELCPICFEYFSIGHQVRKTKCNHLFHSNCIEEWIISNPARYLCPICKSELFEFQVIN